MTKVVLTGKMQQFVRDSVATGRYETSSEVLREGVRLLMREAARERALRARLSFPRTARE